MGCLVGEWKGTGQLVMGDTKAELKLEMSCRWQSGGYGVACQSRFTGPPAIGTLEETDLFGFDPGTKKYHWYAVTSMGEVHDHVAEIPRSHAIDWLYTGSSDGKPTKETIRMEFSNDSKQLSFRSESFLNGTATAAFTGMVKK
jgi:hypothetical protein